MTQKVKRMIRNFAILGSMSFRRNLFKPSTVLENEKDPSVGFPA
jgi:hypothetical protein